MARHDVESEPRKDILAAVEREFGNSINPHCGDSEEVMDFIIPQHPPSDIVEALRNFVEAIEAYGETGVWPDNYTLRKLADEGREALNCGHSNRLRKRPVTEK